MRVGDDDSPGALHTRSVDASLDSGMLTTASTSFARARALANTDSSE
eukprot:CAMPEP_0179705654 /NCGR_PEP_ID=MMETSP0937-20121108/3941_1 /TAXON_ID=548131 ORGANISM="Ostreococcus mediterraneus, Strain clade-D-RCC2593" /NCGR_SAMPLE_ID=MMETSP0937 /ASSEMBLY_ACC=CAM_ASM_000575 /LENGTH=46 /DNA_ID= /DNA_START= /DNA_END= /DNA_ORIENTATION=